MKPIMLGSIVFMLLAGCSAEEGVRSGSNSDRDTHAIAQSGKVCRKSGCSNHLCADHDLASTCEWRPEYDCYAQATCELQADGECGFTVDDKLTSCLTAAADAGAEP